jgi:Spy/CpxP family protein refolding chaperone
MGMRLRTALIGAGLFGVMAMGLVVLADDATTQPASMEEMHTKRHKIPSPFYLLSDLTDDQKAQITEIHKNDTAQEKVLKEQEHDAIMALLTDDQKKELEDAETQAGLQRKIDAEEDHAKEDEGKAAKLKEQSGDSSGAATQPTQPTEPSGVELIGR